MSQSLHQIHCHLIYTTKDRLALISDPPSMHRYLTTAFTDQGAPVVRCGGTANHVHVLLLMPITKSFSKVLGEVKGASSRWMNQQRHLELPFAWQNGYAAFGVSASRVPAVVKYIEGQEEHHRHQDFKDELRALLKRHGVEYDERHLWT